MPPARSRPRHHRCQSQEPQKQSSWVALVIRSLIIPRRTNENLLACCWFWTQIVRCMDLARSVTTSRLREAGLTVGRPPMRGTLWHPPADNGAELTGVNDAGLLLCFGLDWERWRAQQSSGA
jgi:hypothetical protein